MKRYNGIKLITALCLCIVTLCGCNVENLETSVDSEIYSDGNSTAEPDSSQSEQSGSHGAEVIPPEETEPAYVAWMREEKVHEIRIEMAPEEWAKICSNPYSGDYHAADVSIDGVTVKNVGVRTRGHGSLAMAVQVFPDSHKYPFKIKFDKYDKDQTFMGLDELALNNGGDDYSFMRDYIGYESYRLLGGEASCVTFFNVYLNDELRGFYVGVEGIDSSYLDRYFDSHKNNLYEGEDWATLSQWMSLTCLSQKKGKDESKDDIKELVDVIKKMPLGEKGDIERVLDVDSALRMFAVNAVLDNRDGYGGMIAHNYYLYNSNGRFKVLPWDMNAPSVSSKTDIASPTIGVEGYSHMTDRPLAKKLMAVDEYYAIYLDYCKRLNEKLPELRDTVLRLHEMTKEYVANDKNKFGSDNFYENQFSEYNSYGVVYFLEKRNAYLTARLKELEGKPASDIVLNPPPPPPSEEDTSSTVQSEPDESQEAETQQPADGEATQPEMPVTPEQATNENAPTV